jgi:hypothetical protein
MRERIPAPERLRLLFTLGLALLGLSAIFGFTAHQPPEGQFFVAGDGHYLHLVARSIAFDGDLDLGNQYRAFGDRWGMGRWPAQDGWHLPPRSIGPALLMVPGLWLHDLVNAPTLSGPSYAAIGPALVPALCFWLISFRLRRLAPQSGFDSEFAALIAVLAFVLPFYAWGRSAYPHAGDALATSVVVFALLAPRPRALFVGGALALCLLMRLQNLLWLLWPALVYLSPGETNREERPLPARARDLALVGSVAALGLVPWAYLTIAHPGSEITATRWGTQFFNLEDYGSDLVRVFFGIHGLITWTPVVLLALVGLLLPNEARRERVGALFVLVALCLVMASVRDVGGGDAFGARRLCGLTPLIAWGLFRLLAALRDKGHSARLAITLGGLGLLAWNLLRVWQAINGELSLRS